jgi:hypothetical protein
VILTETNAPEQVLVNAATSVGLVAQLAAPEGLFGPGVVIWHLGRPGWSELRYENDIPLQLLEELRVLLDAAGYSVYITMTPDTP